MKVFFLGTNGWFDTQTGNTVCTLIRTDKCDIILDAGFGICKAGRLLDARKPAYIFLSHLHLDHIIGLHALAKFNFPKGLTVYSPEGTLKALKTFLNQPFTVPPAILSFSLRLKTVPEKTILPGVKVEARELVHSSRCLGYRFACGGKTLAYCTDTGICKNLLYLARQADLLITECALKKGQKDGGWPHLNPVDAALAARISGARRLILTHFDAHNYQSKSERQAAQKQARKIFPGAIAAHDGLSVELSDRTMPNDGSLTGRQ